MKVDTAAFVHADPLDRIISVVSAPTTSPPAASRLHALSDQCVMCGLCLPHCPTYRRDRVENRSPRGRIALIAAIDASSDWLTPAAAADLDSCLSCLRCQQVCPAKVRYGELIDTARQRWRRPGWWMRGQLWLVARPRLLGLLTACARRLRRVLPFAPVRGLAAPSTTTPAQIAELPVHAYLLEGCSARALEPEALQALLQLCQAAGLRVQPLRSGCCGALHRHGGLLAQGEQLAATHWRRVLSRASAGTALLGWASGCQHQLQQSAPQLGMEQVESVLPWSARELLPRLHLQADATALPGLWSPCTVGNLPGAHAVLEQVLRQVQGTRWRRIQAMGCCGAAGVRHLNAGESSRALTDAVLDEALAQGCTVLLGANPGCLHALRARASQRGLRLPVVHLYVWLLQRLRGHCSSIAAEADCGG